MTWFDFYIKMTPGPLWDNALRSESSCRETRERAPAVLQREMLASQRLLFTYFQPACLRLGREGAHRLQSSRPITITQRQWGEKGFAPPHCTPTASVK